MELNRIIFPAPISSYSHESLKGKLIYIPRNALNEDYEEEEKS